MANLSEVGKEMLLPVHVKDYQKTTPRIVKSLELQAKKMIGTPVIHVSATPVGGGVAEMLKSQISIERSLGLDSRWFVIDGADPEFFNVTKKIHNLLQGEVGFLSEKEKKLYLDTNQQLGQGLSDILRMLKGGIVIIHDPQPLATAFRIPQNYYPILRIHIDLSSPNLNTLEFFKPDMLQFSTVVVSNKAYASSMSFMPDDNIEIIYPSIDPLASKNRPMSMIRALEIVAKLGIDVKRPIISQISRLDPWKDPIGVINAYRIAKKEIPDLQLILSGFIIAQDDPEAGVMLTGVIEHAKNDPDIYVFSDPKILEDITIEESASAIYTASIVVVQKSLREGFGLTMTEAMWKGKAVVAGKTAGGMVQIKDGVNGFLVESPEEAGEKIVRLMKNGKLREKIGKSAAKSVKNNFLITRPILDFLKLYERGLKKIKIG